MIKEATIIVPASTEWLSLVNKVVTDFDIGQLIPHDWLRHQFGIEQLDFKDYPDIQSVKKAIEYQQFTFLQLFEKLRKQCLKEHKWYLVNVRGMGYKFIHPKDQTQYAYDQLLGDLNKAFTEASAIMSHVQTEYIDHEQRVKDRALFSKAGSLRQLFKDFKQ